MIPRLRTGIAAIMIWVASGSGSAAQTRQALPGMANDPRGEAELTICSQNLENYGELSDIKQRVSGFSSEDLQAKQKALISRFMRAGCDAIAVQELMGRTEPAAAKALGTLAKELRKVSGRIFEAKTGPSNDPLLRVGYLVAKDRAEIINATSYVRTELPRISEKQRPRLFPRGPLEIQLMVKGRDGAVSKTVSLVNFHFKSKRSLGDPTGLEYETYRIEMAEALRRVVENRHAQAFASGETILALLGDRNSHFDVASAKVLEGTLSMKSFQKEGPCRLSKRGLPLCSREAVINQRLFSVLTSDPDTRSLSGTFEYKKVYSWLDDILMPSESLPFAWETPESSGDYDAGVIYNPEEASDHALVYARLNW